MTSLSYGGQITDLRIASKRDAERIEKLEEQVNRLATQFERVLTIIEQQVRLHDGLRRKVERL